MILSDMVDVVATRRVANTWGILTIIFLVFIALMMFAWINIIIGSTGGKGPWQVCASAVTFILMFSLIMAVPVWKDEYDIVIQDITTWKAVMSEYRLVRFDPETDITTVKER